MAAAAIPLALKVGLPILGGLAGVFGNPKQQTTTSAQSGQSNSEGYSNTTGNTNTQSIIESLQRMMGHTETSGTSTPTLSPESTQFMNNLIKQFSSLSRPVNLSPYAAQQTADINQSSNIQSQAVQQALASRGLSTSPVSGTAEANVQAQRIGQVSQLQRSLPLLQEQLRRQNLDSSAAFFNTLPRGVSTTGVSDTTQDTIGTQKVDSNTATSGNTNFWGSQYGGTNSSTTGSGSEGGGLGGLFGGLGAILAGLYAKKP